jgi:hypothetical protein
MCKAKVCRNILFNFQNYELLARVVSTRITDFNYIFKLVLGLLATSERSFELLSSGAKDDLYFKLPDLFLEFNRVFRNGLFDCLSDFNQNSQSDEASITYVEDF